MEVVLDYIVVGIMLVALAIFWVAWRKGAKKELEKKDGNRKL